MRNIRLTIEYDGTDFCGYQVQKNVRTVQGEILKVLSKIMDEPIRLISAARTDTGVHALGQVANFHTNKTIAVEKLQKGMNALLPADIAISEVKEVPESFNARFSALSRVYVYTINTSPVRSAFRYRRVLYHPGKLDVIRMFTAAESLVGERDFSSFRASGDTSRHSIRRMLRAGGWREGNDIHLYFEANAFLQHMVRNIVGTLLMVGRGKITHERFLQIVAMKDRRKAGPTAPPQGLCLIKVNYPDFASENDEKHREDDVRQ